MNIGISFRQVTEVKQHCLWLAYERPAFYWHSASWGHCRIWLNSTSKVFFNIYLFIFILPILLLLFLLIFSHFFSSLKQMYLFFGFSVRRPRKVLHLDIRTSRVKRSLIRTTDRYPLPIYQTLRDQPLQNIRYRQLWKLSFKWEGNTRGLNFAPIFHYYGFGTILLFLVGPLFLAF